MSARINAELNRLDVTCDKPSSVSVQPLGQHRSGRRSVSDARGEGRHAALGPAETGQERKLGGHQVFIVPTSNGEPGNWPPSMVQSPSASAAKVTPQADAAKVVPDGRADMAPTAVGSTPAAATARSEAIRAWAGVAAARSQADGADGGQADGSAAGDARQGIVIGEVSAGGEEDVDFDDLVAGLTGAAATEGNFVAEKCSVWGCNLREALLHM